MTAVKVNTKECGKVILLGTGKQIAMARCHRLEGHKGKHVAVVEWGDSIRRDDG